MVDKDCGKGTEVVEEFKSFNSNGGDHEQQV